MEENGEGAKRRTRVVRKDKAQARPYRKTSILLDDKLDMKLSVYAKVKGMDRSAAAREILEAKLGPMSISLRGVDEGEDDPIA